MTRTVEDLDNDVMAATAVFEYPKYVLVSEDFLIEISGVNGHMEYFVDGSIYRYFIDARGKEVKIQLFISDTVEDYEICGLEFYPYFLELARLRDCSDVLAMHENLEYLADMLVAEGYAPNIEYLINMLYVKLVQRRDNNGTR